MSKRDDGPEWFKRIDPDKHGMRIVAMMGGMITVMRDPDTNEYFLFIFDYMLECGSSEQICTRYNSFNPTFYLSCGNR